MKVSRFKTPSFFKVALFVMFFMILAKSLHLSCNAYLGEVEPLGAHPINPSNLGKQSKGWHDIYLTHRRICKSCKIRDLGNERIELLNKQGVRGEYLSFEVLGVDYRPIQRGLALQVLRNINPVAGNTLMPAAYNQKRKEEAD